MKDKRWLPVVLLLLAGWAGAAEQPNILFILAEDPPEKTDLETKHPEKVKELRSRYDAFAKQSPKVWGEKD